MRKHIVLLLVMLSSSVPLHSQDFGLSFSYFLPRNGYFSTPISPFSIRGLGVNLNRFVALETGASLYRMTGMNLKGLPLESKSPLVGPNFTIFVPAEIVLQLAGSSVQIDLKAGGFFYFAFGNRINQGNFDRAFLTTNPNWVLANGNLSFSSQPGFGYHGGAELTFPITSQLALSLEGNYLIGESRFPVKGSFVTADSNGNLETTTVDYTEAKMDFTGLEVSAGLIFSGGGGKKAPAKRRRR